MSYLDHETSPIVQYSPNLPHGGSRYSNLYFCGHCIFKNLNIPGKYLDRIYQKFVSVSEKLAEKNHTEKKDLDRLLFPYFANL